MTRSLVARELRTLRRQIVALNRRVALQTLPGKVKAGSQDMDKRTLRLVLDTLPDGTEVLSPPVRWQQPGAGAFQVHSVPDDDEQMMLGSPSGTIGSASIATVGTYDADHAAPSDRADAAMLAFGSGTSTTLDGDGQRLVGELIALIASSVPLGGEGGARVAREGDKVEVDGKIGRIIEGSDVVSAI